MIKTIRFVSQQYMEHRIEPQLNLAVISITTPGDSPAQIEKGFHSILRLEFDDLYEENLHEMVGDIPDASLNGYLLWHNLRLPDINHAIAIINFLDKLTCRHVIVHCHAGVSRSAAVAQFVADKYGAVLYGQHEDSDTKCLNKRIFRLLNKAFDKTQIIQYGTYIPSDNIPAVGERADFDWEWLTNKVKTK